MKLDSFCLNPNIDMLFDICITQTIYIYHPRFVLRKRAFIVNIGTYNKGRVNSTTREVKLPEKLDDSTMKPNSAPFKVRVSSFTIVYYCNISLNILSHIDSSVPTYYLLPK